MSMCVCVHVFIEAAPIRSDLDEVFFSTEKKKTPFVSPAFWGDPLKMNRSFIIDPPRIRPPWKTEPKKTAQHTLTLHAAQEGLGQVYGPGTAAAPPQGEDR